MRRAHREASSCLQGKQDENRAGPHGDATIFHDIRFCLAFSVLKRVTMAAVGAQLDGGHPLGEKEGSSDEGGYDVDEGIVEEAPVAPREPPPRPAPKPPVHIKPLLQNWSVGAHSAEVFCVRFSTDSTLVAAGLGNGAVRIYQAQSGRISYQLSTSDKGLPSTAMRFRPSSASSKTRNVLLTANADGRIQHWHVTSGKCLHTIVEPDNQVFAIDYKEDATKFATAGKDYTVRIYDEATKTKVADLCSGFGKKHAGTAR